MNTDPKDLDDEVLESYLEDLANGIYCDTTLRPLGPVIEHDYIFYQDINHYGVTFKEGLHRLILSGDGKHIISYQGPGEEA